MHPFAHARPSSLSKALALLDEHGDEACVLAGGTDLVVELRNRSRRPAIVIDLKQIEELPPAIEERTDRLTISPTVVMADIEDDPRVRRWFPALAEAAATVGSIQIRNRATLAGNICHASPAADTAPALLVYRAELELTSRRGRRRLALDEFFLGPGKTALAHGELVTAIDLPVPGRHGAAFARVTRRQGVDLATINLSCRVDETGRTSFAYGAVGPRPFLVADESGVLADPAASDTAKDEALRRLLTPASPITDVRGSREYRGAMLLVISRRALRTSIDRLNASRQERPSQSGRGSGGERSIRRENPPLVGEDRGEASFVHLTVNGSSHNLEVPAWTTLLDVLRDQLGLTGTKECCDLGECGACTVLVDDRSVNSCLVLAREADGRAIATIEGLATAGRLHRLQDAFLETGAVQCGFCIPGQVMAAHYLLQRNPHPTMAQIKEGLSGNLCRCGGYEQICEAVLKASEGKTGPHPDPRTHGGNDRPTRRKGE